MLANRACAKRSIAESKDDDTIEHCFTVPAPLHNRHSLSHYRGIDPNREGLIDTVYYVAMGYVHVSKGYNFRFSEMLKNALNCFYLKVK